jgi:hypothetical protein
MSRVRQRIAAVLLTLSGIGVGVVQGFAEDKSVADQDLAAWVDQRVKDWQIKPEERPFDAIGWAKDIREAERLAREHQRPVFLFTHDGRMDIGRC